MTFQIEVLSPNREIHPLSEAQPELKVGRGPDNQVRLEDTGLSRTHGRIFLQDGKARLEDLGSRNGTFLNGERIAGSRELQTGDRVEMGRVVLRFQATDDPEAVPGRSRLFSLEEVRRGLSISQPDDAPFLDRALGLLRDLSLALLQDEALEAQVRAGLSQLAAVLSPRRLVVLLRNAHGDFAPFAAHPPSQESLPVSRTAIAAICASHQALLVNDFGTDLRLRNAESLMASAVQTLIAAPLECEGSVEGLLYADRDFTGAPFETRDLALLATVAHLLAARVRTARLLEEKARTLILEQEMAAARRMQQNLLPTRFPDCPGFELAARSVPSRQVSGDLFGLWTPNPTCLYGAVADVAGKGLGPGLLMACLMAYTAASVRECPDTGALATRLSESLAQHTSANRYATAFLFALDLATARIQVTNAGHNSGFLIRSTGEVLELAAAGLPLAIFPGTVPYGQATHLMQPGDLLFLYTDGVTEASSPTGEEFDAPRLTEFLLPRRHLPLPQLLDELQETLRAHVGSELLADDQTFLALRRRAD